MAVGTELLASSPETQLAIMRLGLLSFTFVVRSQDDLDEDIAEPMHSSPSGTP